MIEKKPIIAPIEVDSFGNVHCQDVLLPHRFVEYKGCLCSVSFYVENNQEKASNYTVACVCPDTIDISFTGVVEKGKDGKAHVGKYVFSEKVPKAAIKNLLGKTIIVSKIHPIVQKGNEYNGVIIKYRPISDGVEDNSLANDPFVYYLIDTNVFIDCPEILERFDEKSRVIIVNQVIFELDGLKKSPDENVSRAARESTNNILDVSGYKEMLFVKTKEPYVPFESPCTTDQKILAAAFVDKLKGKKIVLVSSDKNMRLMAKAYDIYAESLEEFLMGNTIIVKRKKKVNWKVIILTVGLIAVFALGFVVGRATASKKQ